MGVACLDLDSGFRFVVGFILCYCCVEFYEGLD